MLNCINIFDYIFEMITYLTYLNDDNNLEEIKKLTLKILDCSQSLEELEIVSRLRTILCSFAQRNIQNRIQHAIQNS